MLSKFYGNLLNMDILRFEDLRSEDSTITAPEYVKLSLPLPELEKSDCWWENLPSSSEFSLALHYACIMLIIT